MLQPGFQRTLLSFFVAAIGGMSMTTGIYPYATVWLIKTETFDLGSVFALVVPVVFVWGIGGALVGWFGGRMQCGLILGITGIISGLILSIIGSGGEPTQILVGVLTGVLYGGGGGLLLGSAFPARGSQA